MAFFFARSINTITPWAILIHIDERMDIEMKIVSCIFCDATLFCGRRVEKHSKKLLSFIELAAHGT